MYRPPSCSWNIALCDVKHTRIHSRTLITMVSNVKMAESGLHITSSLGLYNCGKDVGNSSSLWENSKQYNWFLIACTMLLIYKVGKYQWDSGNALDYLLQTLFTNHRHTSIAGILLGPVLRKQLKEINEFRQILFDLKIFKYNCSSWRLKSILLKKVVIINCYYCFGLH